MDEVEAHVYFQCVYMSGVGVNLVVTKWGHGRGGGLSPSSREKSPCIEYYDSSAYYYIEHLFLLTIYQECYSINFRSVHG